MDDLIRRHDVIAILSQSKTVSQAWDGVLRLPAVNRHEETIRKRRQVANDAALTCDAIEIGLVEDEGGV